MVSKSEITGIEKQIIDIATKRPLVYSDIEPIVEYIAAVKSKQFGSIGVYAIDDVAQEIRLKCSKIIAKFRPGTHSAFNFFGRCVDNCLRDLRRRHTLRRTNVCARCVFYRNGECFLHGEDLEKCDRYKDYLENKRKKEGIAHMRCDPEFSWNTQQSNGFIFDQEEYYERAIDDIGVMLPSGLIVPYRMMLANSGISPEDEERLFDAVKDVVYNTLDW